MRVSVGSVTFRWPRGLVFRRVMPLDESDGRPTHLKAVAFGAEQSADLVGEVTLDEDLAAARAAADAELLLKHGCDFGHLRVGDGEALDDGRHLAFAALFLNHHVQPVLAGGLRRLLRLVTHFLPGGQRRVLFHPPQYVFPVVHLFQ